MKNILQIFINICREIMIYRIKNCDKRLIALNLEREKIIIV